MESKQKRIFNRKGLIIGLVIILFVFSFNLPHPVLKEEDGYVTIQWDGSFMIAGATENTTVGTSSGFLEIFFVNHSATPSTAYDENDSSIFEGWANASLDPDGSGAVYKAYANYGGFDLTLKWNVDCDMVIRYRGNETNAKNSTIFNSANCRVKVNASGGGGATLSSQVLTNVVSQNNSGMDYIWINAYYNIGSLEKGGTYTITDIKFEFNY